MNWWSFFWGFLAGGVCVTLFALWFVGKVLGSFRLR